MNQGLARVSNRPQIPDWKQRPAFSPKGAGLSHGGCKPFYRAGTGLPRRDSDSEVLLTAQEAQADTALDTLDAISDDSAAVVLSDNYDTAAINHGPHASARAVMAQQIPHQEEAQVSLQDGVEQIDVDRQYCVEKGADRGGEDNEEDSCLPVQASVIRFRKGAAR